MSFDSFESSLEFGQPIYLYRFALGDQVWRYTSADADLEINGDTWIAVPISDDGVSLTGDPGVDTLTINLPSSAALVEIYQRHPPAEEVQVAIFRTHEENDDPPLAIYVGELVQVNIPSPGMAKLSCATLSASMEREGLRLGWQRGCPYALYDPVTCKVDRSLWGVELEVSAVVDLIVTVPGLDAFPQDRFNGGYLEWYDVMRGVERRAIEQSLGNNLTIFGSTFNMQAGMTLTAFPGCPRNVEGCDSFDNRDNYGGIPPMQGYSPFDGNPVFH